MPRRRNVANSTTKSPKAPTRRSARRAVTQEQDVPEVYQDMLFEAFQNNPDDFAPSPRPAKRRRVNDDHGKEPPSLEKPRTEPATPAPPPLMVEKPLTPEPVSYQPQQVIFNNDISDSDSESDSDPEFEDVEIADPTGTDIDDKTDDQVEPKSIQIDLSITNKTPSKAVGRRKPVTKAERDFRLHVHKWHLLCLILHVATRTQWCDDGQVQKTLKGLVSRKMISNLHLPDSRTQAERKYAFERAIEEVCAIWKARWKVSAKGMRRAVWRDGVDMAKEVEDAEDPVHFDDFRDAAKRCTGSRDLGAQLFCALLRSVAVETRLVCSVQVLPFSSIAKGETSQKTGPAYIQAGDQDFGTDPAKPSSDSGSRRRKKQKKVVDSAFPVWWVEVFNPAIVQWIPLDPVVRDTINKPRTGFEPPGSDNLNGMSYVVAFEDDGTAKDVTRRYVSLYNAKTRRTRVESTKGGAEWFAKVMRVFAKSIMDTKDAVEDATLDRRVATEGMPKNMQDFKDHPVYVLERHLRLNEVIHPRRESGKFTVGTGKNQRVESVFRREDVHACRSADGWYRRGRDVGAGEQPLKRVAPKRKRAASAPLEDEEEDEAEGEGVALYAEFQTDVYLPPPVVDGRVPRNGYGNLDVYVSTMIPAGGVHVRHPLAVQAAKTLGIDAAEAVTGFKFKGRQGTAIVDGVVIDARFAAAMLATLAALEAKLEAEIHVQRTAVMMGVWKKMHAVLRVRQKVQDDYGGDSGSGFQANRRNDNNESDEPSDDDDDPSYEDDADAGGFVGEVVGEATKASEAEELANMSLLKERAPIVLPPLVTKQQAVVTRSPHKLEIPVYSNEAQDDEDLFGPESDTAGGFGLNGHDAADEGGGFMVEGEPDEHDQGGGFVPDGEVDGGGFVPEDDDQAGGFAAEDNEEGGFIIEDNDTDKAEIAHPNSVRINPMRGNTRRSTLTRRESTNHYLEEGGEFIVPELQEDEAEEPLPNNLSQPDLLIETFQKSQSTRRTSSSQLLREGPEQSTTSHPVLSTQTSNGSEKRRKKGKQKETELLDDDSMSDASLLSHDPEEDDAEPEWLADAFDDDDM